MTDVSFDLDVLLDQAIEEALEEAPPCEVPRYAATVPPLPPCPEPSVWLSICPSCGFRIAWCQMHRDRLVGPGTGTLSVSCVGPSLGGCDTVAPLAAYAWERIG